jgi:hypothetical protein
VGVEEGTGASDAAEELVISEVVVGGEEELAVLVVEE